MQKLVKKDKKRRRVVQLIEKERFAYGAILRNSNFFMLIRWNAFLKLKNLVQKNSAVCLTSRCLVSINRKRFNSLTTFSRHIFLKLIRSGLIVGMRKSSW